jgi:S1 RNA binding domain protein
MSIELGSKLEGKVTGITNFGAFVLLPSGVTGLVHISEIADSYVKDINEHLKVNDPVTVKVINVDKDGKIGLSIRQALPQAENKVETPSRPSREQRGSRRPTSYASKQSFDDKLSRFLKDSEERLQALKRSEGKRGGRGGRRG